MSHKFKRYDLEHHYFAPEYREWMTTRTEAPCWDPKTRMMTCGKIPMFMGSHVTSDRPHCEELFDFDEKRIAAMDRAGIDCALLSTPMGPDALTLPEGPQWCRRVNDAVADYASRFPGRILGGMSIPVMFPDMALKEMERCVKELGFRMWLVDSNFTSSRLSDPQYEPILAKAAELGCTLYVHPGLSIDPELLAHGFLISSSALGFGQDVMKTVSLMLIGGTFDRHPNLRLIIGHLGEYFPFILDRMENRLQYVPDPNITMKHPLSYYFKNRNIVVTTSGNMSKGSFMLTKEKLGIESMVFGSDYPFENFNESVNFIESLDLTEDEQRAFWCDNVEKFILA